MARRAPLLGGTLSAARRTPRVVDHDGLGRRARVVASREFRCARSAVLQVQAERGSRGQPPHRQSRLGERGPFDRIADLDRAGVQGRESIGRRRVGGASAIMNPKMSDEVSPPAMRRYDQPRASSTTTSGHIEMTAPKMRMTTPDQIQETSGLT